MSKNVALKVVGTITAFQHWLFMHFFYIVQIAFACVSAPRSQYFLNLLIYSFQLTGEKKGENQVKRQNVNVEI